MTLTKDDLAGLIDSTALRQTLTDLTKANDGDGSDLKTRSAVLGELKEAMKAGRAVAEKRLNEDGGGMICAQRLSFLQDELIRVIYDFALYHVYRIKNPSTAERMAVVAVGGYGRGTLAPGSDLDLLFVTDDPAEAVAHVIAESRARG